MSVGLKGQSVYFSTICWNFEAFSGVYFKCYIIENSKLHSLNQALLAACVFNAANCPNPTINTEQIKYEIIREIHLASRYMESLYKRVDAQINLEEVMRRNRLLRQDVKSSACPLGERLFGLRCIGNVGYC